MKNTDIAPDRLVGYKAEKKENWFFQKNKLSETGESNLGSLLNLILVLGIAAFFGSILLDTFFGTTILTNISTPEFITNSPEVQEFVVSIVDKYLK